jgi:aromatic-L-amino-acid decarboxylase
MDAEPFRPLGHVLVDWIGAYRETVESRADLLARFGEAHLRRIPIDAQRGMRAEVLADAVERDRTAGLRPCIVVATAGTTNTTAFDPLDAIGAVTERNAMWLHVDAAMAGAAMVAPECRALGHSIERAGSLVLNPQVARCRVRSQRVLLPRSTAPDSRDGTDPAFLRTAQDGQVSKFATSTSSSGGGSVR